MFSKDMYQDENILINELVSGPFMYSIVYRRNNNRQILKSDVQVLQNMTLKVKKCMVGTLTKVN